MHPVRASRNVDIFVAMRILSLALVALAAPLAAQTFDFAPHPPYRSAVPRPESLLGYGPGDRHTQYDAQQRVLDRLAAAPSERARFDTIGVTEEGRVMRVLVISSPTHLARLDAIRADLARLADPRATTEADANRLAAQLPAVAFLSYSIHGNEPAGFEAAMWVAYDLLASDHPDVRAILDSTVVVINPSANPDGHERFAVWSNSVAVGRSDPAGLEWAEPWAIWGRFSHYRFDMNRDMIAQSQAPTRAMLQAMNRWRPHVVVDHHSTTEQYFFPPFADPVNTNIPADALRWVDVFGRGNAEAFDTYGWQYYTRDIFDGHYPGYFDAAPMLRGATGMTYETDGGKALRRLRDDGTEITFREGIAHHMVASLATLRTLSHHRTARVRDGWRFHRDAIEAARRGAMKRVVILPDRDPTNAAHLATILLGHGIEVRRLEQPYIAPAAHPYLGGAVGRRTFPAGALVVDLAQPQGRMATALLEPDAAIPEQFRARELARRERNIRRGDAPMAESSEFYDITAWSLPFTMGLEAFWTEDLTTVTGPLLGGETTYDVRTLQPAGSFGGRARSAYVFANDRQTAAELALRLLDEGFIVNAATRGLVADGRDWPRGTFVIRVERNAPSLHERLEALALQIGVPVVPVQSAFPDRGQDGVGSESVRPVAAPRILVAAGDGISQLSYGAVWYFLERELRYPFLPVPPDRLSNLLSNDDFNVLILPSGSSGALRGALGETGINRLKDWVRRGGAVIAWGGSAGFLTHESVALVDVTAVDGDGADPLPADTTLTPPLPSPAADTAAPAGLAGAIFRGTLDRSHWLTLGYAEGPLPVMVSGSTFWKPGDATASPVSFVGDSLRLSGFTWPNTQTSLQGTAWAAVGRSGRGHAVVMQSDPLFRAFWRGTGRLVTNAILFGTDR
jgi:hypothetical protein